MLKRIVAAIILVFVVLALSVVLFRFVNPPITTVMIFEKLKGYTLEREWVPLERISPHLPVAVIAAEDGQFCRHWGVDWGAVRDAIEEAGDGGLIRGASTIPMQTAKNLYLWTWRSYIRKVLELPLAYAISAAWPKRRVMEVYLNIVQWGPGVFGAEAASRHHFGKSAAQLTRREAALLAASLPNPWVRNPGRPGPHVARIAGAIERRMPIIAGRTACVRARR